MSKAPTGTDQPTEGTSTSTAYGLKRMLLGKPLFTERLEHERLGKPTALAIFSSDNMSSVAYATEEILRVLIPAAGFAVAFSLVLPVSFAIVLVEAILIFSYRQTIKAYPSAGGAYIVTKDNLGLLPAQLAGVALLVDYVLTVSVSTAAGVQAISSVYPLDVPMRIAISLFFVWLIAYGNLRGVRESGKVFAAPTYAFIISLFLTCGVGLYEVLSGHLKPFPIAPQVANGGLSPGVAALTVFVVLRAFASGGAAVTGVEAISNGVPAFKKPEWKNAQTTLVWMGLILGSTFLAVSYLAHRLHVVPVADESKSVLAQIGQAVYGTSPLGHLLFLFLQIATTLILILAANTSFADFPRLASFHAGDAFMPRQLTKRGHKLVFSNGIIALAAAASVIILLFRASVSAMIPLYAIGVFTSFTLSQTGMAKRHLRLKEPGWFHGLLINGLGAFATLVVGIIIAYTKFLKGAWGVMVFVPILVYVLVHVNHLYEAEDAALMDGLKEIQAGSRRRSRAVVLVDALDAAGAHAVAYALTLRPDSIEALHISETGRDDEFRAEWGRSLPNVPLTQLACADGDRIHCVGEHLRTTGGDAETTLVVATKPARSFPERFVRRRQWRKILKELRGMEHVSIAQVRAHGGPGFTSEGERVRILPRSRHVAVILVDRLDRSVLNAIERSRAIGTMDIRALHAATDPAEAEALLENWIRLVSTLGIPLDIEHCQDRNIARTVREYIEHFEGPGTEVSVILPMHDYPGLFQQVLHDHTAGVIVRGLHDMPHVNVVAVPWRLEVPKRRQANTKTHA